MDSIHNEERMESNYEREWTLEFHGINYEVFLSATESLLSIDLEQIDSNDRWSGQFTLQYIEQLTHQVGNYKQYGVFVKMLISGFNRDSGNVFLNLLTYNDMQQLKAQKQGVSSSFSSQSSSSISTQSQSKRFIILTYTSEFDRAHFPLPLLYEENPNPKTLLSTIKRLRKKLKDIQQTPPTPKEREILTIDSNLRQENTELKHRLRQLESRVGSSPLPSSSDGLTIQKLRKKNDFLKNEIKNLTEAYEKLKFDSTREISRWRSQDFHPIGHDEYKMKYIKLQHLLEKERIEHQREINKLLKEMRDSRSFKRNSRSPSPATTRTGRKLSTQSMSVNRLSSGLSTVPTKSHTSSLRKSQRTTSPSPDSTRNGRDRRKKETTSAQSHTYASLTRSKSPSSSSSLGRRFDPTAYAQDRAKKAESSQRSRAWASGRSSRYGESGYSSANSQSSNGSRKSARSNSSTRSRSSRSSRHSSRGSVTHEDDFEISQHRKKRTKKRESTKVNREKKLNSSHLTPEYETLKRNEMKIETKKRIDPRELELSNIDNLLLTSGNLKAFELTNHTNLTSTSSSSWKDSSLPLSKPPLHQKHISVLDEMESSGSENDDPVKISRVSHSHSHHSQHSQHHHHHPGRESYSAESDGSDSEGEGMIFPSKPILEMRVGTREGNISTKNNTQRREKVKNLEVEEEREGDGNERAKQEREQEREQEQEREEEDEDQDNMRDKKKNLGRDPQNTNTKSTTFESAPVSTTSDSHKGGQSDVDQRINALQKFLHKARNGLLLETTNID